MAPRLLASTRPTAVGLSRLRKERRVRGAAQMRRRPRAETKPTRVIPRPRTGYPRHRLRLAIVATLALTLSACGGTDDAGDARTTTTTPQFRLTAVTPAAAPASPIQERENSDSGSVNRSARLSNRPLRREPVAERRSKVGPRPGPESAPPIPGSVGTGSDGGGPSNSGRQGARIPKGVQPQSSDRNVSGPAPAP